MLGYSPTKTQVLGNPDKSANPTASSPASAGLAGEHCNYFIFSSKTIVLVEHLKVLLPKLGVSFCYNLKQVR